MAGRARPLDYGARCPQPARLAAADPADTTPMAEDCLVANVWTPALADGGARPMMVWFHDGGFSALSGSSPLYDGAQLCRRGDVVVVLFDFQSRVEAGWRGGERKVLAHLPLRTPRR